MKNAFINLAVPYIQLTEPGIFMISYFLNFKIRKCRENKTG